MTLGATAGGGVITISGPTSTLHLSSISGVVSAQATLATIIDTEGGNPQAVLNLRRVFSNYTDGIDIYPGGIYYESNQCTTGWPGTDGTFATQE